MRPNWGAICVGGALAAVGGLGLEGGSARAQAAGGSAPAPIYGLPGPSYAAPGTAVGLATPRPISPAAYPAPGATGVGAGASPARAAAPNNPAAAGDGAALTSTALPASGAGLGVPPVAPVAAQPAAGHSAYFQSELPPSPPTRLERMRQRVRGFIHRNGGHEAAEEHAYSDPSTGRGNLPISKPWLTPNR